MLSNTLHKADMAANEEGSTDATEITPFAPAMPRPTPHVKKHPGPMSLHRCGRRRRTMPMRPQMNDSMWQQMNVSGSTGAVEDHADRAAGLATAQMRSKTSHNADASAENASMLPQMGHS